MNVSASKLETPSRALRRLGHLTAAALEKEGAERALIVDTVMKILDECTDAEYGAVNDATQRRLAKLGIEYGWDD